MLARILIGGGILMIVAGIAPAAWEIYKILTEPAGVGAFGGVMPVFLVFVGILLLVIGAIKFRRDKNSSEYL